MSGHLHATIKIIGNYTRCSENYPTAKKLILTLDPVSLERFPKIWGVDKNGKERWYRRLYHMERTRKILFASDIRCDGTDMSLELRGDGIWDFNDNQTDKPDQFQIQIQRRFSLQETSVVIPPYHVLGGWLWKYPKLGDPGTTRDEWRISREGCPELDH